MQKRFLFLINEDLTYEKCVAFINKEDIDEKEVIFVDSKKINEFVWSVDDYVNGKSSICREERQYALYLSNVLRYYNTENYQKALKKALKTKVNLPDPTVIFQQCGLSFGEVKIENVFYEATFMRDIFERNRRWYLSKDKEKWNNVVFQKTFNPSIYVIDNKTNSFNRALLNFCWKKICERHKPNNPILNLDNVEIEEKNYGMNDIKSVVNNDEKFYCNLSSAHSLARVMMNAKPDLAVIYYNGKGKRKFLFIECKFDSDEDYYYFKDIETNQKRKIYQREVQGLIAEFLCNKDNPYLPDLDVSELMNNSDCGIKDAKYKTQYISRRITFIRTEPDADKNEINIADLIKLDKSIFDS